jgi:hypothetical protein
LCYSQDINTDEIRKTGDVITYVSESSVDITTTIEVETAVANDKEEALDTAPVTSHINNVNDAVGEKIAKDFGKQGYIFWRGPKCRVRQ